MLQKEIERKFLVRDNTWKNNIITQHIIKQGYLHINKKLTSRVRLKNDKAYLTLKGKTEGISRSEFEYEIPLEEAKALLKLCENEAIEKVRYEIIVAKHKWEIDVFGGENTGLILAEIELASENEVFEKPSWLGKEVSHDKRYYNAFLVQKPFAKW